MFFRSAKHNRQSATRCQYATCMFMCMHIIYFSVPPSTTASLPMQLIFYEYMCMHVMYCFVPPSTTASLPMQLIWPLHSPRLRVPPRRPLKTLHTAHFDQAQKLIARIVAPVKQQIITISGTKFMSSTCVRIDAPGKHLKKNRYFGHDIHVKHFVWWLGITGICKPTVLVLPFS